MKMSKYTDSKILSIPKQNEQGLSVPEIYREHGMSDVAFYKWRAKFGVMDILFMKCWTSQPDVCGTYELQIVCGIQRGHESRATQQFSRAGI